MVHEKGMDIYPPLFLLLMTILLLFSLPARNP